MPDLNDTGDGDVAALEDFPLVGSGFIGPEVDYLVRLTDASSVVLRPEGTVEQPLELCT